MRKLFGTDGIRGEAGSPPLVVGTLYRLGRALVVLRAEALGKPVRICLARDTRESGPFIEAALARGIRDAGGVPVSAGVMPTPALALLTREQDFAAGLMISASHNPFGDNGVKVFDERGTKLSDEEEAAIERRMESEPGAPEDTLEASGEIDAHASLGEHYLAFLERCLDGVRLEGLSVVLDAAHGAAFELAEEAFRRAGAEVFLMGAAPDGRNINEGFGSLHPERMGREVVERGAHMGFAFDGDADRCIAAGPDGRILDGDFLLYYAGRALARRGRLPGDTVVATVMSNLGLEKALEREGIRMLRAPVGDRYVLAEMRGGGFALGGEQSGHVIFLEHAPTGDGILSALMLASLASGGAGDLLEAHDAIPRYPQLLRNVRVREKPAIAGHPVLGPAVADVERRMGGEGRVVVRYSGTEPKARVMIEGPDEALVESLVAELCDLFEQELGAGRPV